MKAVLAHSWKIITAAALMFVLNSCDTSDNKYVLDENGYPVDLIQSPDASIWDSLEVDVVYVPTKGKRATQKWIDGVNPFAIEDNVMKEVLSQEEADSIKVAHANDVLEDVRGWFPK